MENLQSASKKKNLRRNHVRGRKKKTAKGRWGAAALQGKKGGLPEKKEKTVVGNWQGRGGDCRKEITRKVWRIFAMFEDHEFGSSGKG